MELGQMRCDANLSLRPHGREKFGTRSETKNVNSLRSVERAVNFEIRRHAAVLNAGDTVIQETRHFHENDGTTSPGRVKEEAEDYRYFPEPDLVPVAPARAWVEELRGTLPELPSARRSRLQAEWGVTDHDMQSILNAGAVDADRRDGLPGRRPRPGPQVVDGRAGPPRQRGRRRPRRAADHPGAGRRGGRAHRRRHAERQAGAPGDRGRPGRRGLPGAGRRRPRPGGRQRRRRAARRHRRAPSRSSPTPPRRSAPATRARPAS